MPKGAWQDFPSPLDEWWEETRETLTFILLILSGLWLPLIVWDRWMRLRNHP